MRSLLTRTLEGYLLLLIVAGSAVGGQETVSGTPAERMVIGDAGSGVSREAQKKIAELFSLVGFDLERGVLTKKFDEGAVEG